MSVAAAVSKGGHVVLATDSQTDFGSERVPPENLTAPKYLKVGDAYLAATGWALYSNILEDLLPGRRTPPLDSEKNVFSFFNEFWRVLHDRYSFVKDQAGDSDSPFGSLDSHFLVVAPTGIYSVSSDLSVLRIERYFAIGSGAEVAMGAMHALYGGDEDAEAIARRSVEAAVAHNIHCGLPVHLATVRAGKRAPAPRRRRA